MRSFPLVVALVALAALAPVPGASAGCFGPSPAVAVPAEGEVYYVATNGFAIYEESNDVDGLQRFDHGHDDTCQGLIPPDTLVTGLL